MRIEESSCASVPLRLGGDALVRRQLVDLIFDPLVHGFAAVKTIASPLAEIPGKARFTVTTVPRSRSLAIAAVRLATGALQEE